MNKPETPQEKSTRVKNMIDKILKEENMGLTLLEIPPQIQITPLAEKKDD